MLLSGPVPSVWAQEAPDAAAPEEVSPAPAAPDEAPSTQPPNYLEWAFDALGWGYSLIFLFLSFTLVALIVMNLLTARRENVCPITLVEALNRESDGLLKMGQSTLYPMLYNLEAQGIVKAKKAEAENGRVRKYYSLTAKGKRRLAKDVKQWQTVAAAMLALGVLPPNTQPALEGGAG